MKIIRPLTIIDSLLSSTNVVESDYTTYSASTIYPIGSRVRVVALNTHKIYESLAGKTATVTMTIASPCVVSWVGHGQAAGTPISFSTTGALPTGIVAGTVYYVIAAGLTVDAFQVSATLAGTAVTTTGSQSGVHTATASTNYNKTPADNPSVWLDVGATNRWKMFDNSVQSQTTNADSIEVDIEPGTSVIDAVGLINIDAVSVELTVTDPLEGVVYAKTLSGISTDGITDLYAFFFEPIQRITDIAVTDLPPYASATLKVKLIEAGGTPKCGGCIVGQVLAVGDTEFGARVGIQDYSIKQRDSFGNYNIVERAFNKRANFTIHLESKLVDKLQNVLASYRATPIVYLGSGSYGASILYGFYKSFEIEIGYVDGMSVATLEIEGLT